MAAVSGSRNPMEDSGTLDALREVLDMASSVQNLNDVDSKELDIGAELEVFSARISQIRDMVLDLQQKCANPNSDKVAMREELGKHVQSLRGLQGRITMITGKVNQPANQAALEDSSRRISELFDTCLACLHVIEPPPPRLVLGGRSIRSKLFGPKTQCNRSAEKGFPSTRLESSISPSSF